MAFTHCAGDASRDYDVTGTKVDIESDQKWPRPDCDRPGTVMQLWFSYVRRSIGVSSDLFTQSFEALAAHIFQSEAFSPQRRALVKVNRDPEFIPNALAGVVGERDAFVQRDAAHGNKRQNVGGADARMLSGVRSQID